MSFVKELARQQQGAGRTHVQQMYCPKGKATSVIVEDPFDDKETLQGIADLP